MVQDMIEAIVFPKKLNLLIRNFNKEITHLNYSFCFIFDQSFYIDMIIYTLGSKATVPIKKISAERHTSG
jgi:hypothetical protein